MSAFLDGATKEMASHTRKVPIYKSKKSIICAITNHLIVTIQIL
jgi:hypothetical protein